MDKVLFYALYGTSIIILLFLLKMSVDTFLAPYSIKSEIIILLAASVLLGSGLYLTYNIIKNSERYYYACGALGITWLITLGAIIVGMVFFSKPLKWH